MRTLIAGVMLVLSFGFASAAPYNNGWNHDKAYPNYRQNGQAQRHAAVPQRRAQRGRSTARVVARRPAPQQRQTIQARLSPAIAQQPIAQAARTVIATTGRIAAQILPHPAGCPKRLFCGCGAALKVFGSTRPAGKGNLWHTSGWLRMPRTAPAAGMAAVNSRHVFVIEQVLGNGMVVAYDANSGGGKTRRHVRSLAGFVVVNPHG